VNPLPQDAKVIGATMIDFGDSGCYLNIFADVGAQATPMNIDLGTFSKRVDSVAARKWMMEQEAVIGLDGYQRDIPSRNTGEMYSKKVIGKIPRRERFEA
jgi:hypothetical protein